MEKKLLLLICVCSFSLYLEAQQIKRLLIPQDLPKHDTCDNLAVNKVIPEEIRTQALLALVHYPELKNIRINFRVNVATTPLTSRPTIWSVLFKKPAKRMYLITISNKSLEKLEPILFKNLPFNAQVGVLGHELAHTADFLNMGFFKMIRLAFGQLSTRYLDRMEYLTDQRTIDHGLGWQLLSWSTYVRNSLDISMWKGAHPDKSKKERYMNPETILSKIKENKQYHE